MRREIYQVDKRGNHLSMQRNRDGKRRVYIHTDLGRAGISALWVLGSAVAWTVGQQVHVIQSFCI